jgi:tetratricopeptide (TPR) repeat protein
MPPRVRIQLLSRLDLGDPVVLRAVVRSGIVAVLAGAVVFIELLEMGVLLAALAALAALSLTWVASAGLVLWLVNVSADTLQRFVAPSGSSTPSLDDYSREKALLARGRVDEALEALRLRLANHPDDPALCVFMAETCARSAARPAEAEKLFLRARELKGATPGQDYYATNRLIDLYLGVLDQPERAREELERLRLRHPGSDAAAHAGQARLRLEGSGPAG